MTTYRTSLRPATPTDADFLRNLFAADKAAEFAAQGIPEAIYQPLIDMQYRGRVSTFSAKHPDAESWIICEGTEAVGQYLLVKTPQGSRLIDLAVLPQLRGQGIATSVLQQLMQHAAAEGQTLGLRVTKNNPAQRLYARLGFEVVMQDRIAYEMVWKKAKQG